MAVVRGQLAVAIARAASAPRRAARRRARARSRSARSRRPAPARPRSRHATWIASAMIAVESASVPSQSNTMSRNRRGAASAIGTGARRRRDVSGTSEVGGQRRGTSISRPSAGCANADAARCRNIRFRPSFASALIPREVAVLVVAGEREAEMREMHADLVRAARQQLRLEQRERRIVVGPRRGGGRPSPRPARPAPRAHARSPSRVDALRSGSRTRRFSSRHRPRTSTT